MTDAPKIVQPKLADAFSGGAAPDRAAGLAGLLSKRTDAPSGTPAAQKAPERHETAPQSHVKQAEATGTQEASTRATRPARRAAQPRREDAAPAVHDVGVYLDPDIVLQLRAKRREGIKPGQPERTYDELLVDALGKVATDQLVAAFRADTTDAGDGIPRRIRRPKGTGTTMIPHRLTSDQRDYLDGLAANTGAPSRSALVNTVYRLAYKGP